MGIKSKLTPELKIKAVEEYLNNNGSIRSIAKKYGVILQINLALILQNKSAPAAA